MKLIISFLVFILSTTLIAQNNLSDFNWLVGKWKLQTDKYDSFEEWEVKNESTLAGTSYMVSGDQTKISEHLLIQEIYNHIAYIASPSENPPTLFTLISSEDGKFVFENKEHDFPQRIIYEQIDRNTMTASIEGDENGEFKKRVFPFKRVVE